MSIKEIKDKAYLIFSRHDVKSAAIFGSYARGEERKGSDIDILIEYKNEEKGLFDLIDLKIELENEFKKKIDLGEYCAIRPRIRDKILKEQIFIYEERS